MTLTGTLGRAARARSRRGGRIPASATLAWAPDSTQPVGHLANPCLYSSTVAISAPPPAPPPLHSTWLPCPLPHSLATPTPPIPPLHLVWRSPLPRLPSFPHLVLPAPTPAPNPRHPLPALSSVARQRPIPIGPHTRSYALLCLPASSPLLNHCPRPAHHT